MIHPAAELRFVSPEVGYGVFATEPIPRGTIAWTLCRFDMIFSPIEVADLPAPYWPIIEKYGYTDADGNQILCWDNGRYVNHSCDPAMLGVGGSFDIAVRDIARGEEITCDYAGLNLTTALACRCGTSSCRGVIGGDDVLRIWPELDARIAQALRHARDVAQPLLPFAPDAALFWDWADGRAVMPSHRALRELAQAQSP